MAHEKGKREEKGVHYNIQVSVLNWDIIARSSREEVEHSGSALMFKG